MQNDTEQTMELALEKAAKMICTLKLGLCPIKEKDFSGCPWTCHEEVLPWQCWMVHIKNITKKYKGNEKCYER